jgi:hypothetical protein
MNAWCREIGKKGAIATMLPVIPATIVKVDMVIFDCPDKQVVYPGAFCLQRVEDITHYVPRQGRYQRVINFGPIACLEICEGTCLHMGLGHSLEGVE